MLMHFYYVLQVELSRVVELVMNDEGTPSFQNNNLQFKQK